MSEGANNKDVPLERKQQLLAGLRDFASLPPAVHKELAEALKIEVFPPGGVVVAERDMGDRMYILESGIAEVSTIGPKGRVVLDGLNAGDMFGEIALISKIRRRKATVTAVTELVTVSLSVEDFERTMKVYPEVLAAFMRNAEVLMSKKLHKVSPMH